MLNSISNCCTGSSCSTEADRRMSYVPPVQVYDGPDAFQLVAEVPGADEQSTEVSVDQGVLTLSARMTSPKPEGATLAYSEFVEGVYHRRFALSDAVDPHGIEATVAKGVLTVRLPKARAALPHKIRVVAG